jgi:putative ABC transport system permease protein
VDSWLTVVGVVADVKHTELSAEPRTEFYLSYQQTSFPSMSLVVRTASDPASLTTAIRKEVWAIDQDQPIARVETMDKLVATSVGRTRFNTLLLAVFAAVALVLSAVGVYGIMAYSVTQRTHEIGIRMALGAQTRDIFKMVIGHAMLLAVVGIGIGLTAAYFLTRVMSSLLFGVSATDPLTFAGVSLVLALVALLATYIPARRAMKVDPMIALRYE